MAAPLSGATILVSGHWRMMGFVRGESGMEIVDARLEDAPAILAVQRLAFAPAAERYDDDRLPPLVETDEDIARDIREQVVLIAVEDSRVVGSVRGVDRDGCVYVGRLVVHPAAQRRGIARRLMLELECRFTTAPCFELFTGNLNEPGMGLYRQLGYVEVERRSVKGSLELVYMRKTQATT
jgi:ribosomal protein S18 acetylase RimI-like enzyme